MGSSKKRDQSVDYKAISAAEYNKRLGELVKRWKTQHAADLEIRYQTGALLNERYGPPETRQERGEEVFKELAEKLGTSQSDVSRMRRFANLFSSFEDFRADHPEATTWSAVKELLPKRKQKAENRRPRKASSVKKAKRLFDDLASTFSEVSTDLSDTEKRELVEKLWELVKAVENRLRIQVSVRPVSEFSTPASPISSIVTV
jgi:uncharacterized tellurite resistance protein B-like protein